MKTAAAAKASTERPEWSGCGTALITPFDEKGRIDFGALLYSEQGKGRAAEMDQTRR